MAEPADPDTQELLRKAHAAIRELRSRLRLSEARAHAPIAIVGMSCRFPGGVDCPAAFWSALAGGVDAISEVPADRWDSELYYDPDPDRPGKICTRWGGFLPAKDEFDARFFRISPREANFMDPQHRLLLELAWEALEHANLPVDGLYRSNTGVFVGISSLDFSGLVVQELAESSIDAVFGTGGAHSAASGRISHAFGFQGPSLSIDTACSSSLVAVQVACDNLRGHKCDLALVGGVNLILSPFNHIVFSRAHMLAPDGRCKTFDDAADGYVRSEGAGMVVLKRLDDAVAAGDRVLSVIRGCAVNQDGPSGGLTVPNGPAQQQVILQALADAGLNPAAVGYIEAHGTGTALGDPIELHALAEVFSATHSHAAPLFVGSAKTNLGHMEPAAGVAGLIKLVLQLQHGAIAPHLHFDKPSRLVAWDEVPIEVPTRLRDWPRHAERRVGGVSSFGFTGTNAHVIVEEAAESPSTALASRSRHVLCLSARSPAALSALEERYLERLRAGTDAEFADLCHSANAGRSQLEYRLAIVSDGRADAIRQLERSRAERRALDTQPCRHAPKVGFLFSGQGSQYPGMARELFQTEPRFRERLELYHEVLQREAGLSLIDSLYAEGAAAEQVHQTRSAQPLIVSVQLALVHLLGSWGVAPAAVLGHSVGEFSAAVVANVLSAEQMLGLVAERGRLMQALDEPGGMLAVFASELDVQALIQTRERSVAIAAVNGPTQTVISGARSDLAELKQLFTARGISHRELRTSHAFHSPLMLPAIEGLRRAVARVQHAPPSIDFISNVSGRLAGPELAQPEYWLQHAQRPVRFADGLQAMYARGCRVFLEIGPKPTLIRLGPPSVADGSVAWLGSLDPRRSDWEPLLESVGALYLRGAPINWEAVGHGFAARRATLPSYPFERKSHWFDAFPGRPRGVARAHQVVHPLLGTLVSASSVANERWVFEAELAGDSAYLGDHRVFDHVIFPATGYLELALAAAVQAFGRRAWQLEDVSITLPLRLEPGAPRLVATTLARDADGSFAFQIRSRPALEADGEAPELHARGRLRPGAGDPPATLDLTRFEAGGGELLDVESLYRDAATLRGLQYGERFRGMRSVRRGQRGVLGEAVGEVALPSGLSVAASDPHVLHPVLLDSAFQFVGAALPDRDHAYLPIGLERLEYFKAPGARARVQLRLRSPERAAGANLLVDLGLFDEQGNCCVRVVGLCLQRTEAAALRRLLVGDISQQLYRFVWTDRPLRSAEAPESGTPAGARLWLVVADTSGVAPQLGRRLRQRGERCAVVLDVERAELGELDHGQYSLDLTRPEQLAALWGRVQDRGEGAAGALGVVFLRCLDLEPLGVDAEPPLDATGLLGVGRLLEVVRSMLAHCACPLELSVVTRGALSTHERQDQVQLEQAAITGFVRAIRDEVPALEVRQIDLDPQRARRTDAGEIARLAAELLSPEPSETVALRGTARLLARLEAWRPTPQQRPRGALEVTLTEYGSPDNLGWAPAVRRDPNPGEVEIAVRAAGVNFKDVLHTWGLLKAHAEQHGLPWGDRRKLGFECSGVIVRIGSDVPGLAVGDSVIGIGTECLSHYVTLPAATVVRKPSRLDFPEAAGLPTAFLTVFYGLVKLAQIRPGDRVLIHAAAGGVGQAAVQLCKRIGAEIFATASLSKWDFLHAQGVTRTMNSRTLDFKAQLLESTGGRGVDVVLNSLTGDFIPASLDVLAPGGRFVEIGKRGIWPAEQVRRARPDVHYFTFDLGEVDGTVAQLLPAMLATACDWIAEGSFQAPPVQIFPVAEVREAFRQLAQAKNVGKVVIEFPPLSAGPAGAPPQLLREDATYLVTGGLGGLGLATSEWLAERGARQLVLASRGPMSVTAQQVIEKLGERGTRVQVLRVDLTAPLDVLREALQPILDCASAPLAGIVHAAGTIEDATLEDLTWESCRRVLAPKVTGAWNLHCLTRHAPLDFFVCYSSVSGTLGAAGQAAYAAANTFLDALMQHRRALGLPGLSIAFGPWASVGMAARMNDAASAYVRSRGVRALSPEKNLAALGWLLEGSPAHVVVTSVDWNRFAASLRRARLPEYLRSLVAESASATPDALETELKLAEGPGSLRAQLVRAPSSERRGLLSRYLRALIARTLRFSSIDQIDPRQGFFDMGVDSLSAVELKTRLEMVLGSKLLTTTLLDFATPDALTDYVHGQLLPPDAAANNGRGHATEPVPS